MIEFSLLILPFIIGWIAARNLKQVFTFFDISHPKSIANISVFESVIALLWAWSFAKLPMVEALVFSSIVLVIGAIAWIDLNSFKIPHLLIGISAGILVIATLIGSIPISSVLWGIGVGAFIPWILMVTISIFTKREGMGFGDIQLGFVLGMWLGPIRMALSLFSASFLSLFTWVIVSMSFGFDKDRALPFAPFLVFTSISIYIASVYYPKFFHHLMI